MNIVATEVFNRYEKKYIVDTKTFLALQERLLEYMEPDEYNRNNETYSLCNIYYDTPDSLLIRNSLDKPKYKEKLRLRSYGIPGPASIVYLEIKKKVCGLVNKRRSGVLPCEAYKFTETGVLPEIRTYMNRQVLCEIKYLLEQYPLAPVLFLSYERRAFFSNSQRDLRISFDTNILTRRTDLKLESGIFGEALLEKDIWLMEIKASRSTTIRLDNLQ